jgi:post-segregation antitoxin (ccd killing protein)
MCMREYAKGMRTSVVFDDELAAEARELGINVSEAARAGVRQAVRRRRAARDRAAYLAQPETEDVDWDEAESWGEA